MDGDLAGGVRLYLDSLPVELLHREPEWKEDLSCLLQLPAV
jgi:hypothetical protein